MSLHISATLFSKVGSTKKTTCHEPLFHEGNIRGEGNTVHVVLKVNVWVRTDASPPPYFPLIFSLKTT